MKRWFAAGIAAVGLSLVAADTAQAQRWLGGRGSGFSASPWGSGAYIGNRNFGVTLGNPGYGWNNPGNWGSGYGYNPYGGSNYGSGISLNFGNRYPSYGYGSSFYQPSNSYSTPIYSSGQTYSSGYSVAPSYSYSASSFPQTYSGSAVDLGSSGAYSASGVVSGGPIVSTSMGQCHDGQISGAISGGISSSGMHHESGFHGSAASTSAYSSPDKVSLVIRVADANAEVLINGQETQSQGTERHFVSPSLEAGNYQYEVSVRADGDTKKRTVDVKPGDFKTVDFTSGAAAERSSPGATTAPRRLPADPDANRDDDANRNRDLNRDRDRDRDNENRNRNNQPDRND